MARRTTKTAQDPKATKTPKATKPSTASDSALAQEDTQPKNPAPVPKSKPETKPRPKAKDKSKPEPEPDANSEPDANTESEANPQPKAKAKADSKAKAKPKQSANTSANAKTQTQTGIAQGKEEGSGIKGGKSTGTRKRKRELSDSVVDNSDDGKSPPAKRSKKPPKSAAAGSKSTAAESSRPTKQPATSGKAAPVTESMFDTTASLGQIAPGGKGKGKQRAAHAPPDEFTLPPIPKVTLYQSPVAFRFRHDKRVAPTNQPERLISVPWRERSILNQENRGLTEDELEPLRQRGYERITWLLHKPKEGKDMIFFFSSKASEGGPFAFLSTMAATPILVNGLSKNDVFHSAEHAFQFMKCKFMSFAEPRTTEKTIPPGCSTMMVCHVAAAESSSMAIELGRSFDYWEIEDNRWWRSWRRVWEPLREQWVKRIQMAKFEQHPESAMLLLMTGNFKLYYAHQHHDILGIGYHAGKALQRQAKWGDNVLGKVLEEIRDELRKTEKYRHLPRVYHFWFWRHWEETLNDERNRDVLRATKFLKISKEMKEADAKWRQERDKRIQELRQNFEQSRADEGEDFDDEAVQEKWVERLLRAPWPSMVEREPNVAELRKAGKVCGGNKDHDLGVALTAMMLGDQDDEEVPVKRQVKREPSAMELQLNQNSSKKRRADNAAIDDQDDEEVPTGGVKREPAAMEDKPSHSSSKKRRIEAATRSETQTSSDALQSPFKLTVTLSVDGSNTRVDVNGPAGSVKICKEE